jgi:hypothetical protein
MNRRNILSKTIDHMHRKSIGRIIVTALNLCIVLLPVMDNRVEMTEILSLPSWRSPAIAAVRLLCSALMQWPSIDG